ncbi:MAG TPA: MASE4 domain-containing protein [Xanthobacteraceae bacterium]
MIVLALLAAFFVTAGPLSSIQLAPIQAFIPIYATAMFVNDSLTAVLLFAQFSILHSRALLVIATGYLFTALMLIPWMLTFPGVFAAGGLLDAGLQSTAWLYIIWHAGFPIFVIGYGILKDDAPAELMWKGSVAPAIAWSVVMTVAGVCTAAILVTAGNSLLAPLMLDTVHLSKLWLFAAGSAALLSLIALAVLWLRQQSVLDLWLMVVMCAFVIEICLISFPIPARYSIGWYTGRVFGVLSGSIVLLVLLYEISTLYARLLRAVLALRREREARLMTGDAVAATIAHEIKQPLSGLIMSADAGLRFLDRATPDLIEAKDAFRQVVADGHRMGEVIGSIRAIFKRDLRSRISLDINEIVREALRLAREEVRKEAILVRTELNDHVPQVKGDRIQLQQVLVNLITNAIESMAVHDGPRILSVSSRTHENGGVTVSIADTGMGVVSEDIDRIFNPLFTTKSDGMGMGLSICRSIIEAHDGRLRVAPNKPQGAIFQFSLGVSDETIQSGSRRLHERVRPAASPL